MGVASSHELEQTFENELGGSPKAVRKFAVTLSNDTLSNNPTTWGEIITHLGLDNYGASHPDLPSNPYFGLRKVTVAERMNDSPYHALVTAEYGPVSSNELLNPTGRDAEWEFQSKPSQVAALYYWDGTTRRALTNSAFDYYEGLTTEELIIVAKISKNYADFDAANGPADLIKATNKLNSGTYLGTAAHTWKVAGVQTSYVTEFYNNVPHQYWRTTSELQFRQSTWNLFLPDVGWNFIAGGQKRRAMVFDFENGEWVASPNPVGLNGSGGINFTATPFINERRVHEETNFSLLFGTPPTV